MIVSEYNFQFQPYSNCSKMDNCVNVNQWINTGDQ